MSKDLLGFGDNDISELDSKKHQELCLRNPGNDPEVTLEQWTLAHLTRNGLPIGSVVYGVVTECLTDDYSVGDIVCSPGLLDTPEHPGRRIYVTQRLRYECKGAGNEITIPEGELSERLPDPNSELGDIGAGEL